MDWKSLKSWFNSHLRQLSHVMSLLQASPKPTHTEPSPSIFRDNFSLSRAPPIDDMDKIPVLPRQGTSIYSRRSSLMPKASYLPKQHQATPGFHEICSMNTCDKLLSATVELAGSGSIKQRLVDAYVHHLAELNEEQMPQEIRDDFCALTRALRTARPLRGEDAVLATVRKMSDCEAKRYAAQIVNMFGTMARNGFHGRRDIKPDHQSNLNSIVSQRVVSS
jgi:hypothetical protein